MKHAAISIRLMFRCHSAKRRGPGEKKSPEFPALLTRAMRNKAGSCIVSLTFTHRVLLVSYFADCIDLTFRTLFFASRTPVTVTFWAASFAGVSWSLRRYTALPS